MSGYAYVGGVEAVERDNDAVVTVGVREAWETSCNYVEVTLGGLFGRNEQLVLLDMSFHDARQLAKILLQATRDVLHEPTNNGGTNQ